MNFLACDSVWFVGPDGQLSCPGSLRSITVEELTAVNPAISLEDANELIWLTAGLFAAVFAVLVIKKVL
jgi:hypothetical protein